MKDHVYRLVEVVGSSEIGVEDAIKTAIGKASETLRHIHWFHVTETRGEVRDGKIMHYQVTLKIGFTVEDEENPPR